jgi:hypothetical protein
MRSVTAVVRGYLLLGLTAAALASTVSACSDPPPKTAASDVSCTNYAIHASGNYHDEVWVRVNVSNSTTHPARYAIEVDLSVGNSQAGAGLTRQVTISGLVAAKTSAELGRKVLTTDAVKRCRVTGLSRS